MEKKGTLAREYFEMFMVNEFAPLHHKYSQIIYAYLYLNSLLPEKRPITIEKFKSRVRKIVDTNEEFIALKNYLELSKIDNILLRTKKAKELNVDFTSYEIDKFNSKILQEIFDETLFMNRKDVRLIFELIEDMKLIDICLDIQNEKNKTSIVNKIIDYIENSEFINWKNFERILMKNDNNFLSKMDKFISSLSAKKILDFIIKNQIYIPYNVDEFLDISNKNLNDVISLLSFKIDSDMINMAKKIRNLFSDDIEKRRHAYQYLLDLYPVEGPTDINKFISVYLSIKLDLKLDKKGLNKLIKTKFKEIGNEFNSSEDEYFEDDNKKNTLSYKYLESFLQEHHDKGICLQEYLITSGIIISKWKIYSEVVKNTDLSLYEKYCKVVNNESKQRYISLVKNLKEAALKIKSDENFNILDYYSSCDLPLEHLKLFVYNCQEISIKDKSILSQFSHKYRNAYSINREQIDNMEIYIGGKIEYGKIVGAKIMSQKDKEIVYKYLENNNIPLSIYSFNLARERLFKNKKNMIK